MDSIYFMLYIAIGLFNTSGCINVLLCKISEAVF